MWLIDSSEGKLVNEDNGNKKNHYLLKVGKEIIYFNGYKYYHNYLYLLEINVIDNY